ncbi:tyrosinase family protein [Aspergillus clavatus NRRL 1]|uniref:Tyrosinase central domain protein n=1 Tax=Aspergillus clavatus (strain ATCC 1007 / CBS 513.65 / DSM 816 / NCTC 3887 / NRRL 1 / QM 1276 / 107) TaxID=344612 RepID=A1CDX9_ASPCL|nr:tyrosinase central domain protein [Aspergillus clavatus NRRL 1]EAW12056.1 tyrosinase central domain protein [Aspergillus clavatus NRRL 1]
MIFLALLWLLPVYAAECTPQTKSIRREWGSLSRHERLDYINAIKCMQQRPPHLSSEEYPAVRHRMDDFTATHVNYATQIHTNGALVGWHREFLWLWEQALRDECGYRGAVPYWNWSLYPDLASSPLFDGSPTSFSGDGDPNANYCVTNGPFVSMQTHFSDGSGVSYGRPANKFDYTPHCLRRRLNSTMTSVYSNADAVAQLLASPDIIAYQERNDYYMDPVKREETLGLHPAGHRAVGLTMADFFSSPQDPVFMLHHAMLDRVWAIWQAQDGGKQRWAINGTMSFYNEPTTPEITLDTVFEFGTLGKSKPLRELMDPEAYSYCYGYE